MSGGKSKARQCYKCQREFMSRKTRAMCFDCETKLAKAGAVGFRKMRKVSGGAPTLGKRR